VSERDSIRIHAEMLVTSLVGRAGFEGAWGDCDRGTQFEIIAEVESGMRAIVREERGAALVDMVNGGPEELIRQMGELGIPAPEIDEIAADTIVLDSAEMVDLAWKHALEECASRNELSGVHQDRNLERLRSQLQRSVEYVLRKQMIDNEIGPAGDLPEGRDVPS
jgi:hypothetical protein